MLSKLVHRQVLWKLSFLADLCQADKKLTSAQHSSLSSSFYIPSPSLGVNFGPRETDNINGLIKEEQLAFFIFSTLVRFKFLH